MVPLECPLGKLNPLALTKARICGSAMNGRGRWIRYLMLTLSTPMMAPTLAVNTAALR